MAEVQVNPEDVKTAGYDPRFPNTNQTKHCWANYVFYHRCRKVRGADDPECRRFFQTFQSLCPEEWVEKWDEQRSERIFPGLPPEDQGDE